MKTKKNFVAWDMKTKGLKPLMHLLKAKGYQVPGLDNQGGDLIRSVIRDGVLRAHRVLAFTDLPNANVGYELGYALGSGKQVAVLYATTRSRPDWLRFPPMNGILCTQVQKPEDILNLGDKAFWTCSSWQPQGEGIMLLCPGGIEGSAIKYMILEKYQNWPELPEDGWNINELPEKLEGISTLIWIVTTHREGGSARDGSENARNSIIAGFAEASGLRVIVLISEEARNLVDQEDRAHYFSDEEYLDILGRVLKENLKKIPASSTTQRPIEGYIEFSPLLRKVTQSFVGRTWLTQKVDDFLKDSDRGFIVVKALPGMGKTAFLANMIREREWIHHFNSQQLGVVSFEQFLLGLRAQIIQRYGFNLERPGQDDLRNGLFLQYILEEVGGQMARRGERITIVVDALDEAMLEKEGAQPLYLPTNLPPCIRLMVSFREDEQLLLKVDPPFLPLTIDPASDENRTDVRDFLTGAAYGILSSHFQGKSSSAESFVERMLEASEGNFMYVRAVVNEILTEDTEVTDINNLPKGLTDYYERHWQKILKKAAGSTWAERILHPTLCVLCVAEHPMTLHEILAVLHRGFPELKDTGIAVVQSALNLWGQFLTRVPDPDGEGYQIYHKSFRDFLSKKPSVSGELQVREVSRWMADAILDTLRGG